MYFILLLLAVVAYGQQQERVAIINTVDNRDSIGIDELAYLTDKLRETAVNILPKQRYGVMTTESIVAFLGSQERAQKECKEASCLAELGRKVNADYVAQARIGRFGKDLTIKVELYNSKSGNLVGSFTGNSKNIYGLLAIINEKAQPLFKELPSTLSNSSAASLAVAEKVSNLEDGRDGKKYKTVVIGKQTWMAENLNYNANGSKCYNNKPANCDMYGRLYDWNTAKTACPKGWHLPSDKDWNVLMKFVNPSCSDNSKCDGAGTKLKANSGWNEGGNGVDDFGFAALPGGYGRSNGYFNHVGYNGYWWSSSEYDADIAYSRVMGYNIEDVYWNDYRKYYLFSVRCVKD